MASTPILAQSPRDRDLVEDDGLGDVPARDRKALKALDHPQGGTPMKKRTRKKTTSRMPKAVMYSSTAPKGLWPVGTTVKYIGGSRLKNKWLKKGAVGRVFGYRPGRKGGGLYAVRFEGGATLLSVKRVEKVKGGGTR